MFMQEKADGMQLNTKSHRAGFKKVLLRTCIFLRMQSQNDKIKAVKACLEVFIPTKHKRKQKE